MYTPVLVKMRRVRRLVTGGQRRCHRWAEGPNAALRLFYSKHVVGSANQLITRPIIDTTPIVQ